MAIGALLIAERFLPHGMAALVPMDPAWQLSVGLSLGLCIGMASTFLGVAGGELLIPTLMLMFGTDILTAGAATGVQGASERKTYVSPTKPVIAGQ